MRELYRLGQDTPSQSVHLPWYATDCTVVNPTQNIILVRAGANDTPSDPSTSDFWVPPYTAITHPVNANQFGIGIGSTALAAPSYNSLFPKSVTVIFTVGETPPTFGSMSVGVIGAAATVVGQTAVRGRSAGTFSDSFAILPGIRTITMVVYAYVVSLTVTGDQSGTKYYGRTAQYNDRDTFGMVSILIDTELDSSVTLTYTQVANTDDFSNYISVVGYQERLPPSTLGSDGIQRVKQDTNLTYVGYLATDQTFTGGTTYIGNLDTRGFTYVTIHVKINYFSAGSGVTLRVDAREPYGATAIMLPPDASRSTGAILGTRIAQIGPGLGSFNAVDGFLFSRPFALPDQLALFVNVVTTGTYRCDVRAYLSN